MKKVIFAFSALMLISATAHAEWFDGFQCVELNTTGHPTGLVITMNLADTGPFGPGEVTYGNALVATLQFGHEFEHVPGQSDLQTRFHYYGSYTVPGRVILRSTLPGVQGQAAKTVLALDLSPTGADHHYRGRVYLNASRQNGGPDIVRDWTSSYTFDCSWGE